MDLERQVAELTSRVAELEAIVSEVAARQGSPAPAASAQAPSIQPPPPEQPTILPPLASFPPPSPADRAPAQSFPPPAPGSVPSYPPPPPGVQPAAAIRKLPAFEWGIETLLRWAGVILVALAAIFLVSTAITRGWIGPELQLLGAAIGGAFMHAGAIRLSAENRRPWALALGCGGAVVLAVSAIATHEWLDVVSAGPALVLLAAATAVSVGVALHLRLEGITVVASVAALLTPLETLSDFGDAVTLTWICACILGATALGLIKTWPGERLVTGWLGALLLVMYALNEDVEGAVQILGFVGAAIIGAALWAGPVLAKQLSPSGSGSWGSFDWSAIDYRMVALVPAWMWAILSGLIDFDQDETYGLMAIATAVGFLALAEVTFGRVERLVSIATFFGSFTLLAVGFAVYFDGPGLMVALAGQAATSYYLARRLGDDLLRVTAYLAGALASLVALVEMADAIDNDGFPTIGAALATAIVVLCWIAAAVITHERDDVEVPFDLVFIGAWAGTMVWLAALLLGVSQGLVLISAAWAAMACAGLIFGLTRRLNMVKNVALATLVLTLGKLVTIDMAEVDVFWRVGLFFVVGMGLIALGLKIPSLMAPEEPQQGSDDTPPEQGPAQSTLTTF